MDYRTLHTKTVADLRRIAKEEGVKVPAGTNKALLVQMIVDRQVENAANAAAARPKPAPAPEAVKPEERGESAPAKAAAASDEPAPARAVAPSNEPAPVARPRGRRPAARQAEAAEPERAPVKAAAGQEGGTAEAEAPAASTLAAAPEAVPAAENPAVSPAVPAAPQVARPYQRQMSTQQRMGARIQPQQGGYRPQPRPAQLGRPARFSAESAVSRPTRAFDGNAGFRRVPGEQGSYRRPVQSAEFQQSVEAQRPAGAPEQTAPAEERPVNAAVSEMIASGDFGDGAGILEIHADGYGFLRADNYLPGNRDVYVSAAQIRRFNLRTGDYVVGKTRPQQMGDRSVGLIYINEVNGQSPDMARSRRPFDSLIPVYPDERLRMERPGVNDISLRIIDMIVPIGKGQRGMIVSQPKAGKTTLLKKIANAITANNSDVHLIVLLIDERPEEVTDMQRSIQGEVVYSTFDEAPENHTRVSEMVLERAQRLVELGKDVVVLLDSITRLARAYNLVIPPTGRSLSGGLDPGALYKPKRFFGAARNIENGGSLTIIATALVDTGSRMDDIIFEEFKGTGNMELHLDRSLSDRRIFPAIDMYRSSTRREELLLTKEELDGVYQVRKMLSKGSPQEAAEQLISLIEKTKTNEEFFQKLKGWLSVYEKEGFKM